MSTRVSALYVLVLATTGIILILQVFFGTGKWLLDLFFMSVELIHKHETLILNVILFAIGIVFLFGAYDEIKSIRKSRHQSKKNGSVQMGPGQFGDWGG